MEMVNLSLTEAYALAHRVLRGNGFSEAHAAVVAKNVTHGERDGCASHGLWRLLGIVATLHKGKVSPDAEPVITDTAPAIVKVDAGGAFSLLAFERALPLLMEKARHSGMAALAINRCVHFSALFADVEPLTDVGLVALATTPSHAWVAPAGGTKPLFGTNPIAFGWPRGDKPPFIFDMATSAAARGEIQLHQRAGKAVPEGWGIDRDGQATTDAQAILDGAMLTFGGYKGSALAAMVELLGRNLQLTAVFAYNDNMAAGALTALKDNGIAIPLHLSIIGFDDIPIARYTDPQLTTVRYPIASMAKLATELALQGAADNIDPRASHCFMPTLVRRHSVATRQNAAAITNSTNQAM